MMCSDRNISEICTSISDNAQLLILLPKYNSIMLQ